MIQEFLGGVVSRIVPGQSLLLSSIGRWYSKNPYHKFNEGDILILKTRNLVGHGVRPVAVVQGYAVRDGKYGKEGLYELMMHTDSSGDFFKWMENNEVPAGVERRVDEETHYKWNIENRFKRVPVNNVDEALALYASKEIQTGG
ncbi:hypothetical protein KY349_01990 [Candidatus Woesearchaeota archaeon]|nr:hypothetical protein [Candidatus Woesearchaeota archaeon]